MYLSQLSNDIVSSQHWQMLAGDATTAEETDLAALGQSCSVNFPLEISPWKVMANVIQYVPKSKAIQPSTHSFICLHEMQTNCIKYPQNENRVLQKLHHFSSLFNIFILDFDGSTFPFANSRVSIQLYMTVYDCRWLYISAGTILYQIYARLAQAALDFSLGSTKLDSVKADLMLDNTILEGLGNKLSHYSGSKSLVYTRFEENEYHVNSFLTIGRMADRRVSIGHYLTEVSYRMSSIWANKCHNYFY